MHNTDPAGPSTSSDAPATASAAGTFSTLLVLSGFCGISYEILYARVLGNLIGDQMALSASILMTFLLGIGFGTKYAWRLWRHLWIIEASIGVVGLVFAFGTGVLDSLLYAAMPAGGAGLGASVAICTALLCVPAFLIGCSLPLFAGYLSRLEPGNVFARAYTLYNIGAALTVLLIEFWLIRAFGLRVALIAIALVNLTIAGVLRTRYRFLSEMAPDRVEPVRFAFSDCAALALASIASAVFQLLMIKTAQCLVGPFTETFALVLAIVLLGVALGSAIVEKWKIPFGTVMMANLCGLIWFLAGLGVAARIYAGMYDMAVDSYSSTVLLKFSVLALLMAIPAITFGATIPALLNRQDHVARESGQLLFISSIANAAGFLLMAFVFHRSLDYGPIALIVTGLSATALAIRYGWQLRPLALAGTMFLIATITSKTVWDEDLLYLGHTNFHDLEDLAEAREELTRPQRFKGYQDVFSINWVEGRPYFFINGYTSIPLNSPSEKLVGAFSSICAPRNDEALVLGVGSGATAGTVGELFEHTDAVEINPVVLENLYRMKDFNFDIESNPSVNIVLDDAIHFTKAGDTRYSLIINTVTTPLYFSSSKLYTQDFLEQIRRRLKPDGVYVTWVDSRVGDEGLDITLQTIGQTFDYCAVGAIKSAYLLLLCSDQPVRAHQPMIVADHPELARYFLKDHDLNPDWFRYGLVSDDALSLIGDRDAPVNTLDLPALEFSMTRLRERGISGFLDRLSDQMTLEGHRRLMALGSNAEFDPANETPPGSGDPEEAVSFHSGKQSSGWDPFELVVHTHMLLGDATITETWADRVRDAHPEPGPGFGQAELSYFAMRSRVLDTSSSHHEYGYRLMQAKLYDEAIAEFETALEQEPQRNNTHFNLGACYERMGNDEKALAEYEWERALDPEDEDVPYRVGRVALRLSRFEKALTALDEAITISNDSENHVLRGLALEGLGRFQEAYESFLIANSLRPIDSAAPVELARMRGLLDRQSSRADESEAARR